MYICQSQSPNSSHSPLSSLGKNIFQTQCSVEGIHYLDDLLLVIACYLMPSTTPRLLQVGFKLFACSIMEVILAVVSCSVRLKNFLQESELVSQATFQEDQWLGNIWVYKYHLGSLLNKRFLDPTFRYSASVVERWGPEPLFLISALGDSETNDLVITLPPSQNLFSIILIVYILPDFWSGT